MVIPKGQIPSFRQSSWSESRYYCFTALPGEQRTIQGPTSSFALSNTRPRFSSLLKSPLERGGPLAVGSVHVQLRQECSVGKKAHRGRSQSPVAWIAVVKVTEPLKSIDKAILSMVSEWSGHNESERTSSLETTVPEVEPLHSGRRQQI